MGTTKAIEEEGTSMASVSSSNEAPGTVHLDMITHMLNQGGGAHKAIDRESLYQEAQHEVVDSAEKLVGMKEKADRELDSFVSDPKLTSIGFPPMDKVCRYLVHESADERGLVSYSVGQEERGRHTIVWVPRERCGPTSKWRARISSVYVTPSAGVFIVISCQQLDKMLCNQSS